jgi:hypothetical protein
VIAAETILDKNELTMHLKMANAEQKELANNQLVYAKKLRRKKADRRE